MHTKPVRGKNIRNKVLCNEAKQARKNYTSDDNSSHGNDDDDEEEEDGEEGSFSSDEVDKAAQIANAMDSDEGNRPPNSMKKRWNQR